MRQSAKSKTHLHLSEFVLRFASLVMQCSNFLEKRPDFFLNFIKAETFPGTVIDIVGCQN